MYKVVLKTAAEKFLKQKLERKLQEKVAARIDLLVEDPFAPNTNLDKLQEITHGYRLRLGNVRIIYEVDTDSKTLTVWKINFRGQIYKR